MDGHCTHYCLETIKAVDRHDIQFTLPPNMTHISQPLDKGCFGPLKAKWKEVCHGFVIKHPGKVVGHFTFSQLFRKAWTSSMAAGNIQSMFEVTGVYPLHRTKLLPPEYYHDESISEDLPYMPMLTPSRLSDSSIVDINDTSGLDLIDENTANMNVQANYVYDHSARPLEDILTYPMICAMTSVHVEYRTQNLR